MSRKCPACNSVLGGGSALSLALGSRRRCRQCGSMVRTSPLGMFGLSIVAVFATIASLSFVNLLGPKGLVLTGLVPIAIFLVGSYFLPLVRAD